MATVNKVPTLGFQSSIKGVVLLGFGTDTTPTYADPDVCVQVQADDTVVQLQADDTVISVRVMV